MADMMNSFEHKHQFVGYWYSIYSYLMSSLTNSYSCVEDIYSHIQFVNKKIIEDIQYNKRIKSININYDKCIIS